MPSVMQPAEFFVVGGPVQPERLCYIERAADRQLEAALRAKRLCCVLGPAGIGKSSLLHHAARGLRAGGALVAIVELSAIAEQGGAARDTCLRLVAERIAAQLKLGMDVEAWWADCDAVDESRFVRFCSELVLPKAMAPIVVLLDDIDAALASPFGADLLAAIGSWCSRRAQEPGSGRLRFALAGRTSLRELAQASPDFPAAEAELVEPEDFTAEQSYRLAVAFGDDQELAQALMDRIRAWTNGHPYLTQRVARGVARKDGRFEDVERVVREQVLAADAAARDPLLAQLRAWLGDPSRPARRAAKLLQKVADGATIAEPEDIAVAERLRLSGTVRTDAERRIHVRNRIVKELVHAGWLKRRSSAPMWLAAAAAVLLIAAAAGGYWYTQRLPVADVATLSDPTATLREAEQSYRRLRALPGFEQRADELWTEVLGRSSRAAATLADAAAADTRLRELPGQAEAADRLLSEFWLRRARERAHTEERGAAILLAQRAAALPSADPAAAAYLAELAGDDWSRLERSSRLASVPEYWRMAFEDGALLAIDAERRVARTPFGAAPDGGAPGAETPVLTALVHSALTRELAVDGEGTAGELELSLAVQHAAASDLLVTLTAPSGAAADVRVPLSDAAAVETFVFQAAEGSPLAQLADEGLRGTWRLTVVDRELANTGFFGGWGLRFGDTVVRDDLAELAAIPDPLRSGDVLVQAAGERAVARPASPSVVGSLAVWNLASGLLEHDLMLPEPPRQVALDPTGSRVLAATERALLLWNADGELVARVGTESEFVLPPVFSADGDYVAIAERVEGGNPLYSVLRSADGSHVSSIEGAQDVQAWELGPGGRYVALQGPETVVRVVETRRGAELRRLAHSDPVERLLHSSDGAMLVTVDRAGAIASWPLALASAGLGQPLGRTVAAATVSSSADGRRIAFTRDDGAIAVLDIIAGDELYRLRLERSVPVTQTQLSADGMQLVTQSGVEIKAWRLPNKPVTPRTMTAETMATVVALHRGDSVLALGFASGQLEIAPVGAAGPRAPLSYFGHRGPVTAVALNGSRGLAATGGNDGIVRLWDLAESTPTAAIAQPAERPVAQVVLSEDGRYVASAAERTVRVAATADGRVTAELQTEGAVTALAFEPGSARLAVGDASGAIVIAAPVASEGGRATARLAAAVTALSFAPPGGRLAAADAAGAIVLVDGETGAGEGTVHRWSQPIRWLEFSPDGSALLVATDSWLHALAATPALTPTLSKLVVWPAASRALSAVSASSVRFAGVEGGGLLVSGVIDLAALPSPVTADAAALVARDWSAALALALNDNGDPVARGP